MRNNNNREQVRIAMESVRDRVPDVYGRQDFRKRKVLRLEWKNDRMTEWWWWHWWGKMIIKVWWVRRG